MMGRWGFGPVFAAEWLVRSRRWQVYASRSVFVGVILAFLALVIINHPGAAASATIRQQADLGEGFFEVIAGVALSFILLIAPAATAGAICVDKARGTLTHLLMTDLSSAEIVLGKLAPRLGTTLGLIVAAFPLLALLMLMGGIDPLGLTGTLLVLVGTAVLACCLAMALSVWGRRAHEVLLVTYASLIVWCLASPTWEMMLRTGGFRAPFGLSWDGLRVINPYVLATSHGNGFRSVSLGDQARFFAVAVVLSVLMMALAIGRIRKVEAGRGRVGRRSWWTRLGRPSKRRRPWLHWPGPSLDFNPVLWREWHRRGASGWVRWVWWVYAAGTSLFAAVAIGAAWQGNTLAADTLGVTVSAVATTVGLLLLAVSAANPLAEERQRGSLDVLMATPLSTRSIVLAKWWATFRIVPGLAVWPAVIAAVLVSKKVEHAAAPALIFGLMIAYGAALTSLGLAMATWVPRLGRAMALTVLVYVSVVVGVPILISATADRTRPITDVQLGWITGSPPAGIGILTDLAYTEPSIVRWDGQCKSCVEWIALYLLMSCLLLVAVSATFDRCLGRAATTTILGTPARRPRKARGPEREPPAFAPSSGPVIP